MSRRFAVAAALVLTVVAQPVHADFGRLASGLRSLGFERTWIPFMGLARVAVRVVQPKGVHDFQLAIYEKTPQLSTAQVERMVSARMGRGFSPLVRVQSKGESVFIYAKPSPNGRVVELLILAIERNETVLVRVVADAEVVGRELVEPQRVRSIASR